MLEELTDVYAAVASQEAPPSNLQMQRVTQLQDKFKKAEDERVALEKEFHPKVDMALAKEGLPSKEEGKPAKAF
ncbi:MAG TPA: hypothetical protein VFP87_11325 [Chitinophagaceae bacterium]|nr:hypothetical protein [Chitinophagaceae bacterium]